MGRNIKYAGPRHQALPYPSGARQEGGRGTARLVRIREGFSSHKSWINVHFAPFFVLEKCKKTHQITLEKCKKTHQITLEKCNLFVFYT